MLRWIRPLADRLLPAASSMLLGASQECAICGMRMRPVDSAAGLATLPGPPGLEQVLRSLRPLLCARCLTAVPWIREARCPSCGRAVECPDCPRRSHPKLLMNRSAVQYSRQMKEWLSAYKYQGNERLHQILSLMLDYAYLQLVQGVSPDCRPFRPLITSVPISDLRMQERGFNQAERLAESLAARHRLPYVRLLRRIRHTSRQSQKTRLERIRDLRGAFAVLRDELPGADPLLESGASGGGSLEGAMPAIALPQIGRLPGGRSSSGTADDARPESGITGGAASGTDPANGGMLKGAMPGEVMDGPPTARGVRPDAIVIVDDVYTTGSTLHECARVLHAELRVPIYSVTWAR